MVHITPHARTLDYMWEKRQDCISCEGVSPVCNCAANEQCILTGRSCTQCAQIECLPKSDSGGKSINPGVIAGPVVAALIILGVAALWWLRRKRRRDLARVEELAQRARKAESAGFHVGNGSQPGSPGVGPGSARSSRRNTSRMGGGPRSADPNVPVNAEYYDQNGQSRNGNNYPNGSSNDPFQDHQSIGSGNSEDRSQNHIPIRFHAPEDEKNGNGEKGRPNSFAARALNEARNNLFRGNGAPTRPARSPDLDLRLMPSAQQAAGGPPTSFQDIRSPTSSGNYRDSYLSGNSGAPSYLTSSTDIHLDAPKIVTSRQVQVGRLQQAEMVQFGKPRAQVESLGLGSGGVYVDSPAEMDPFHGSQDSHEDHHSNDHLQPPMPMSPATFGSRTLGSEVSGVAAGNSSYRTLTPSSNRHGRSQGHGDESETDMEDEEGLDNEPISADLRFSMGSLAYNDGNRDSISTMGTNRYLAQQDPYAHHAGNMLPPRPLAGGRESMASARSAVDSVLHGFPMIPPGQSRSRSNSNLTNNPMYIHTGHSPIPQSTSVSTLEHATLSRPPTSFKSTSTSNSGSTGPGTANRNTQASVGLGNFPFVPPTGRDQEELPSAALPTGASDGPPTIPAPNRGRNTIGMSTTSEGLGEFDFSFDRPAK